MKIRTLLALLLLVTGCVSEDDAGEDDLSELVLESGDLVKMDFLGTIGETGEIFDTTYESVAKSEEIEKADAFVQAEKYGEISFTIGKGEVLPALEVGLVGMKIGETKEVTLPPGEAYGEYVQEKVVSLKRSTVIPRLTIVSIPDFKQATGREPQLNESIMLNYWNVTVVDISGENMTLSHEPENNTDISTEYGAAHVTVNATHVTTIITPISDEIVTTSYGTGTIKDINETHFVIDYNHPLAGKTLVFEATVNDILKAGKSGMVPIKWQEYGEGMSAARSENRPSILYFNLGGCRACEAMEKLTFQNPEVMKMQERFVWVEIDSDARPDLVAEYEITGYPTIVVVDEGGQIVDGLIGYVSPYELVEIIDFLIPRENA